MCANPIRSHSASLTSLRTTSVSGLYCGCCLLLLWTCKSVQHQSARTSVVISYYYYYYYYYYYCSARNVVVYDSIHNHTTRLTSSRTTVMSGGARCCRMPLAPMLRQNVHCSGT
jgi:hypothetical protein